MRRTSAARWWRLTSAAAAASLLAAAGSPAHGAPLTQADLQAEGIDTPAGDPQPVEDLLGTGMQPFGLGLHSTCTDPSRAPVLPLTIEGERVVFSTCDTLYIADPVNYVVRGLSVEGGEFPSGLVEFVAAGNGGKGTEGDGFQATSAQLSGPYGVAPDPDPLSSQLFIADTFANQVRQVDQQFKMHRIAGKASAAFGFSGDGAAATLSGLGSPYAIARLDGVTYIADTLDNRVRAIDPESLAITTVVGTGAAGSAGSVQLSRPRGLAADPTTHTLLIGDTGNNRVIRWDPDAGAITAVAGTGAPGFAGDGHPASAALLKEPAGLAVDPGTGTIYIADTDNNRVRSVTPAAIPLIATIAGAGTAGFSGDAGLAKAAQLNAPFAVAVLSTGGVVVGDTGNSRLRLVEGPKDAHPGRIVTLAGNGTPSHAFGEGGGLDQLSGPTAVAASASLGAIVDQVCDASGTALLVLDTFNHSVRAQCPQESGGVLPVQLLPDLLGNGLPGTSPSTGPLVPATNAPPNQLRYPMGLAVGGTGGTAATNRTVVYVSDTFNNVVRRIDTSPVGRTLTTVAGTGTAGFNGDGIATQAELNHPGGLAVDLAGNLYIADTYNNRIREVDPSGKITTIAGTGTSGSGGKSTDGDGGPAAAATLYFPEGVAVDTANPANVYVADTFSHRVRRISAGVISPFAGTGTEGLADGSATAQAQFDRPWGISVDSTPGPVGPIVYVADELNHAVRFVSGGVVGTMTKVPVQRGLVGDLGPIGSAEVDSPRGVTVLDNAGTLLVADSFNDRVRRICGLALSLPGVNFAATRTGTSTRQSATLTNLGCGFAQIPATGVTISGAGFSPGAVGPGELACGAISGLKPGQSCSIGVSFTPEVPGISTGTLRVAGSAGTTATANLTGIGTEPAVTLTAAPVQIGLQCTLDPLVCTQQVTFTAVGATTLTISNPGTAPLHVTNINISPTGTLFDLFQSTTNPCLPLRASSGSISTWPDTTVQPGQSCNVDIGYGGGPSTTTLRLTTDDAPVGTTNQLSVTLVGTAPFPPPK